MVAHTSNGTPYFICRSSNQYRRSLNRVLLEWEGQRSMRTKPKRRQNSVKLALMAAAALLLLMTTWFVYSHSQTSTEMQKLGESVASAVNAKDFTRLEQLLGNPVAVETIRNEVDGENEPVRLGQVSTSNSQQQFLSIIISSTPERELFVYLSKDQSGSWWANVP